MNSTKAQVLEILSAYDETDRWLCGDEVYDVAQMQAQATTIAEEYDLKIETGDYEGTLSDYISAMLV